MKNSASKTHRNIPKNNKGKGPSRFQTAKPYTRNGKWRDRECCILGNGLIRLTTLIGGGHVAEIRFEDKSGKSTINPFWIPPWNTFDSYKYSPQEHSPAYGSTTEGKLLAGISGHNLCMDYFGLPSLEEAALGLSLHGEAPNSKWQVIRHNATSTGARLKIAVGLPTAGLRFHREINMRHEESVVYFEETVENTRNADHFSHWTQHISLGPPFINHEDSRIVLPGSRGVTFPHGYDEGKALLRSRRTFRWPNAPSLTDGSIDLTRPFSCSGRGFVAGVLIEKRRNTGFVAALNRSKRLVIGYCFSRSDFPWVTIWEENRAIKAVPWRGRTQALGLEFGTTPLPIARRENFLGNKDVFGTPTLTFVPARSKKQVRYLCFLAAIPANFGELLDVQLRNKEIVLVGSGRQNEVRLKASGLDEIFELH